jgi:hypothetical protein
MSFFGWNLHSWDQSIELFLISGHMQHQIGYMNQAQYILSARAKTTHMRPRPSAYIQALFQG